MLRERSRFQRRNNRGSILVVSLWVVAILEIFTLTAGYQVRQKISLAERLDRRAWLYGVAEAGIYEMFVKIREEDTSVDYDSLMDLWSSNEEQFKEVNVDPEATFTVGYEYVVPSSNGSSEDEKKERYGAQDEERKINLNTASAQILTQFFQAVAELDSGDASTIAYGIVDWRDTDSFPVDSMYGSEDDYYDSLSAPYEAKDAPFEAIQELLLIRGMNMEIFDKVKNHITVYGTGLININTAPKEVLMAIGLSEQAAGNVVDYRSGPDQEEATVDDRIFTGVGSVSSELSNAYGGSGDFAPLTNLIASGGLTTASKHFMIRSRAEGKGTSLEIVAVVNREGKILHWSAGKPQRAQIITTSLPIGT